MQNNTELTNAINLQANLQAKYWQVIAYPKGSHKPLIIGSETSLGKAVKLIRQTAKANPHYHSYTLKKLIGD